MTTEEKFNAAVNVIRSLPKNGSYQPSNDLMLRFYAYFKQATQGPCTGSRPGFWDLVNRAKYDAWKNLGQMPKSDAMTRYVEELHTIVETMSYTDKVANFLEAPSNELDNLNVADLELVAGDVMKRMRSQPNSPFASRETSPQRIGSSLGSSDLTSPEESDHSDEEFTDTLDFDPRKPIANGTIYRDTLTNGIHQKEHISRSKTKAPLNQNPNSNVDIFQEVLKAVQNLKTDIDSLKSEINQLEASSKRQVQLQQAKQMSLFGGLSPQFLAFLLAWPFIANFIMNRFTVRK